MFVAVRSFFADRGLWFSAANSVAFVPLFPWCVASGDGRVKRVHHSATRRFRRFADLSCIPQFFHSELDFAAL
ncbi:MAG: hypothetical protein JWM11_3746 [Planctomycetaceae bacterium]|nr:hypothetical protein [Planctomycetaceae bacterium]